MKIQFLYAQEMSPYQDQLRALEEEIQYPIADGADFFTIDHGDDYTAFFRKMGDARFLLAVDRDRVVGTICAVVRTATKGGRTYRTFYASDLKLSPDVRGKGLWKKMGWKGLFLALRPSILKDWRMVYVAAMQGERGDVTRAGKGMNVSKLGAPTARLSIYFVEPARLAALRVEGAPPPPSGAGLDLSPDAPASVTAPGWTSTAGCKDLRLRSTGEPWPLVHLPLGPSAWTPTFAAYLQRCGQAIVREGRPGPCCFSLDERLADQIDWLLSKGIEAGATCNVYSFRLPGAPRREPWLHLATLQI